MSANRTKRLIGILLAFVLCFSLAAPSGVLAAGGGISITDNNANSLRGYADAIEYITGESLSENQVESLASLRAAGRVGGLLGFDGEYALDANSADMVNVIVEFVNQPAAVAVVEAAAMSKKLSAKTAETLALADHKAFQTEIVSVTGKKSFEITAEYHNAINGVAVTLPANKVAELLAMDSVFAVYPDFIIQIDPEVVVNANPSQVGEALQRAYLGIDDLHARGITGAGVTVGVIDTGVDYNHPDIAPAFIGGRNYVRHPALTRAADDPMETTYDEWNALNHTDYPEFDENLNEFYTSHGTHVSGTIVGRGVNTPVSVLGMAPEAKLRVYRVLGPYGSGDSNYTLSALDDVVTDGCDVVNLSLGTPVNNPQYATSIAINNIVLTKDIVFAISAGNNGQNASTLLTVPGSLGSPGTSSMAITVASAYTPSPDGAVVSKAGGVDYKMTRFYNDAASQYISNGDGTYRLTYPNLVATDGKYKLVPTAVDAAGLPSGTGIAAEFTAEVKAAVAGNIVVVRRGNNFFDTMLNAINAGAGGVLLINLAASNDAVVAESRGTDATNPCLPMFGMAYADGVAFWNAVKNNPYITFDGFAYQSPGLAGSSSRGPLGTTYDIKPDVAAPGVNVLSSVAYFVDAGRRAAPVSERYNNSYEYYSGTSMSSPHIAGIAALMRGYSKANGLGWSAAEIKARIVNNADASGFVNYSVFETGAGYVRPAKAIDADTYITVDYNNVYDKDGTIKSGKVASLSFGAVKVGTAFNKTLTATLTNKSAAEETFTISNAWSTGATGGMTAVMNPAAAGVTFAASSGTVTVPAGGTATVTFTMTAPANTTAAHVGSYEGFVTFANGAEVYKMPYAFNLLTAAAPTPTVGAAFLTRPQLSPLNGANRALTAGEVYRSDYSDFLYRMSKTATYLYFIFENEQGTELGELGVRLTVAGANLGTLYRASSLIKGVYHRYINAQQDLEKAETPLPYGHTICRVWALTSSNEWDTATTFDIYVDNEGPALTVNNLVGGATVYYDGNSATVSGNVYDLGLADMASKGIQFKYPGWASDQSMNILSVKMDGEYYGISTTASGNFSFTINNMGGDTLPLELIGIDGFTVVPAAAADSLTGFSPYLPSYYGDIALNTAFFGSNMSAPLNITIAPRSAAPAVTDFSLGVTNYVAGLAANVPFNVAGTNLNGAALTADIVDSLGSTVFPAVSVAEGKTIVNYASMPEPGTYTARLFLNGVQKATKTFDVLPLPTDIWTPSVVDNMDGTFKVVFAANATLKAGAAAATLNGAAVAVSADGSFAITVNAPYVAGATLKLPGVKFATYFPSYSFTFTVKLP